MSRKPPKTTSCQHCGQQRRNAGRGLCNCCILADPQRPARYAASLGARLPSIPQWWNQLAEFASARYHPSGSVAVLRETGRALLAQPNLSPHQPCRAAGAPINATTERVLTAFFTSQGLTLAHCEGPERAARQRQRYLEAIPDPLGRAVAQYNKVKTGEQDRRTRTGRRILSDITLATRLRILRDLAADVCATRPVTGWAEVTTDDLERFLSRCPPSADLRPATVLRLGQRSSTRPGQPRPRPGPGRPTRLHRQRARTGHPAGPVPPMDDGNHPNPGATRRSSRPPARRHKTRRSARSPSPISIKPGRRSP